MAPKRKSGAAGGKSERSAKRVSSVVNTPQSIGSSDEDYFSGEEASEDETLAMEKVKARFNAGKVDKPGVVHDLHNLRLKPDHASRPLWLDESNNRITLESFSQHFKRAQDLLITIAEPLSRPSFIHEYTMTMHSLYAGISVGITPNEIIYYLNTFSKTPLSQATIDWIKDATSRFGKIKMVLKNNRYYLETSDATLLQKLLKDEEISKAQMDPSQVITEAAPTSEGVVLPGTSDAAGVKQAQTGDGQETFGQGLTKEDDDELMRALQREEDDDQQQQQVHSIPIPSDQVENVQRRCLKLEYPLLEEYDYNNDADNPNLDIDLRPEAKLRPYQEKSLSKMFGNGRCRSGMIVLPCGAGKTLVGITAACCVRKGIIILCTSAMSVMQWRSEFLRWSNISPDDIAVFTSDSKEKFHGKAGIVVSTYSMVTQTRQRSYDSQKFMDFLQEREWGLMILDEVHVVPAEIFRKVTHQIATHSKLGLTATLLREDDKISDLNFLIGPKLYEANWLELSNEGHIARVQCAEVWCPMTSEFYQEYLRTSSKKRQLLYIMNPRKFQACQFLIDYHERRGDKIIVFSDNVYALERYARKLGKAYIYGGTPQSERMRILENFRHNELVNTVFLSKIGDTSLDLPEATCLIQISSHYGSRRQEAQRLGRILRAKRRNDEGFNAFFYSLVSKDTQEMVYSAKRQAFLVDQGYAYKVITHLQGIESLPGLAFSSPAERRELLQEVMLQNESAAAEEVVEDEAFRNGPRLGRRPNQKKGARRTAGMLSDLSGGQDMAYVEYNKSKNKELKKQQNPFMKRLARDQEKRKQARAAMQS